MTREELIAAAELALLRCFDPMGSQRPAERAMSIILEAVEPLIRADERDECYRLWRNARNSALRAKVEALLWNDPRLVVHDQAINDVLELLDDIK